MKKIILILVTLYVIIVAGFLLKTTKKPQKSTKIIIVTTIFPVYDVARNIAGDEAHVIMLLPPGVEPHTFEPKPQDIATISNADLFIYTGKNMEPWAEKILKGIKNTRLIIVDSSQNIPLISANQRDNKNEEKYDPHIWLDFQNIKIMANNVLQGLKKIDPSHADLYKKNAQEYSDKLSSLDNKFKKTLATCKKKEVVYGGHYAFGYMAKRYGIVYKAVQGFLPESEPSMKDLSDMIAFIKKNNVDYVYYEELSSPKIAQTIANETHTQLLLLNAAHSISKKDIENGTSFISIMERNLLNLKRGLECI
ncbi:hypothetical protein A2957_01290 [Candidatus Roizmanbacteria bacterium RIFCSPLOWO2_01_FULL_38_11]|uniref:Zinc-binding protein n=1 Tax=Candidatus Roizmanbacteria bacterium RIFCSPLOWO2_01_FULL_38_11 TaxID=1802060 RepID=A0A1F7IL37_9BACT|nr:MAG: hypothetical protein A2957_01290 [Candidatus Roizmanbacteria bacterium RIFCSPLOWO2_01_FULL_38_11]